jgi:hypothetical protein
VPLKIGRANPLQLPSSTYTWAGFWETRREKLVSKYLSNPDLQCSAIAPVCRSGRRPLNHIIRLPLFFSSLF